MYRKSSSLISLRRGIRVLEFISLKAGGCTFGEIRTNFLDMTPATLTRLLKSMLDEELLAKGNESRNYQTGRKAKQLACAILGNITKGERLRPVVNELAEISGESALFTEFEKDAIRILVKSEVPDGFHYMDENRLNNALSKHAFGITCLAFQPPETVRDMIYGKKMHGMSRGMYIKILEKIRSEKIFVNKRDDKKNLVRITAPVFYGDSEIFAGALGISFYSIGKDIKRISALTGNVRDASLKASSLLGSKNEGILKDDK
jgi:DNA-binding IclR family transcriptional regulator